MRALNLGRGHTSGDLVVLFVEDRVIHLGDLFFNQRYPNIDLEAGGSIEQWIGTLDRVLAIDGYDHVIPGHGAVTDRDGIRQFQAFLAELWEQTSAAAQAGETLDETLRSVQLTQDAGLRGDRRAARAAPRSRLRGEARVARGDGNRRCRRAGGERRGGESTDECLRISSRWRARWRW